MSPTDATHYAHVFMHTRMQFTSIWTFSYDFFTISGMSFILLCIKQLEISIFMSIFIPCYCISIVIYASQYEITFILAPIEPTIETFQKFWRS